MKRTRCGLITILAVAVLALGCGGNSSGQPATTPNDRASTPPRDRASTPPRDRPVPARTTTAPTGGPFISAKFAHADRILVLYAPDADFHNPKGKRIDIKDAKVIKQWLAALSKIPVKAPDPMKAKIMASASEFRIDFYQGAVELGTLRMKASMLDSPGHTGWVFYGKTDTKAFVALVKGLLTP